jgi:hypothetical protein
MADDTLSGGGAWRQLSRTGANAPRVTSMHTPAAPKSRNVLRLLPSNPAKAAWAVVAAITGVTLLIVALDCWIYRDTLPAGTIAFFTSQPLWRRALADAAGSVGEEAGARLLIMTLLVVVGGVLWRGRDGRPHTAVFIAAIMLADLIDCLRVPAPTGAGGYVYDALRYYTPGLVWGWLYWRHGWVSAAVAHFGIHLTFEPTVFHLLPLGAN